MEEPKVVKRFENLECPHCKGEILVGTQALFSVVSALKEEEIVSIREEIKSRLTQIKFADKTDKEEIEGWIDNMIFDHSDVESVVKQVAMDQIEKLKDKNEKKSTTTKEEKK